MIRDPHRLTDATFDVLVIGGGIHGACAARDAALRGLRTAIVERGDFGSETSHNSLKIVHGGLRYLQHLDFARARESVLERSFWLRAAPQLVRPLGFLMPLHGMLTRGPLALWAGLRMHELIGWDRNRGLAADRRLPKGRLLSAAALQRHMPGLEDRRVTGGALWYDGQMLDADRLLLLCIEDAHRHGGVACNYVSAKRIVVEQNKVRGVELVDELGHETFFARARSVINAAGPWAGELTEQALEPPVRVSLRHTKNMNIVVPNVSAELAIGVQSARRSDSLVDASKRLFFITPWQGMSVIGTTHVDYEGHASECRFTSGEIEAFIAELNSAYALELTPDDVSYCYGGLTPADEGRRHGEPARARHGAIIDHRARDGIAGLVSLIGVKYTTARCAAARAVDIAADGLGQNAAPARSREGVLPGGAGYESTAKLLAALAQTVGQAPSTELDAFTAAFGTESAAALEIGGWSRDDGEDALFRCRVRYAVRREMAVRLEDVIARRSQRLACGRLSAADLRWAGDFMARELGWTRERQAAELAATDQLITRHRARLEPQDASSMGRRDIAASTA